MSILAEKEMLFFEWVLVDNCNLECAYCINKGEFSHKSKEAMSYSPGNELAIAERLLEISWQAKRVVVNLTGGEPTMARHFEDVTEILGRNPAIELKLITNLRNYRRIVDIADRFATILISLHVQYRTPAEIDALVEAINHIKGKSSITLSQVDAPLTDEERSRLAHITRKTGLDICFQTYVPPWTGDAVPENKQYIMASKFVTSRGKRCALGHLYFFLLPDGRFYNGLWCNSGTRRTGDILMPLPSLLEQLSSDSMEPCPFESCGCNYNLFFHREYLAECRKLGYAASEMFGRENVRLLWRLKSIWKTLQNRFGR